jgi:RNA polymerase sigma-70 factor (ECF subfamily)
LRDTDLAEDAVQSALIAAWRNLPSLRDPDRFEAWARKLVIRACFEESNKRKRLAANVRRLELDDADTRDDYLTLADRDAVDRAFRRLTVEQRTVFVLHHHVGLRLVEIAETLGIPAGTARSRLHYATRSLQAAAGDEMRPTTQEQELPA